MRKKKELAKHGFKESIEVDLNKNQKINFNFDPTLIIKVKYKSRETIVS